MIVSFNDFLSDAFEDFLNPKNLLSNASIQDVGQMNMSFLIHAHSLLVSRIGLLRKSTISQLLKLIPKETSSVLNEMG